MGFIVSLKPCLNLCSLRWLKPRRNLINTTTERNQLESHTSFYGYQHLISRLTHILPQSLSW